MGVLRRLKEIGGEFKTETKKELKGIKEQYPKAKESLRKLHEGAKKTHKGLKKVHASLPKVRPEFWDEYLGTPTKKKKKKPKSIWEI